MTMDNQPAVFGFPIKVNTCFQEKKQECATIEVHESDGVVDEKR